MAHGLAGSLFVVILLPHSTPIIFHERVEIPEVHSDTEILFCSEDSR